MIVIRSKLANNLFARELARRLGASSGVAVHCLRPGTVRSDLWRHLPTGLLRAVQPLVGRALKSPEEGCRTILHCAVGEGLESGGFYDECRRVGWSRVSEDDEGARRLWAESERLVKL